MLSEVARHGSLSGAADALSFTQPAVSKQIAQLERETGLALIHRGSRGVRLTEAGRVLVAHTVDVLARLAAAEAALHDLAGLRAGTVRFAAFPSAFAALVPTALRAFRLRFPAIELDVHALDPEAAFRHIRRGDRDLALVYDHDFAPLPTDPAVARRHLLDDPMLAALPCDHRLAARASIDLADLEQDAWIQGASGPTAQLVHHACLAAGFAPRIAVETSDPMTAQGLVAAGIGITLLPAVALSTARPDIVVRPLAKRPPIRDVGLIWTTTSQTPATEALRHILETTAP